MGEGYRKCMGMKTQNEAFQYETYIAAWRAVEEYHIWNSPPT